jgi:hypothetical protein
MKKKDVAKKMKYHPHYDKKSKTLKGLGAFKRMLARRNKEDPTLPPGYKQEELEHHDF